MAFHREAHAINLQFLLLW